MKYFSHLSKGNIINCLKMIYEAVVPGILFRVIKTITKTKNSVASSVRREERRRM